MPSSKVATARQRTASKNPFRIGNPSGMKFGSGHSNRKCVEIEAGPRQAQKGRDEIKSVEIPLVNARIKDKIHLFSGFRSPFLCNFLYRQEMTYVPINRAYPRETAMKPLARNGDVTVRR